MHNKISFPEALADRLVFGFTAVLVGAGRMALGLVLACLSTIGKVTKPTSKSANGYAQVMLHLVTDEDRYAGEVRIDLHLYVVGDNVVFGNRCSIQCNGMTMIRGVIGDESSDAASFNDKINFIEGQYRADELVGQQLEALGEAAQFVLDALQAAFGESWRPGELWLKAAEACRDRQTADAVADIRVIQHATTSGTMERRRDEYSRIGAEERDGIPTLRFITLKHGPQDKLYPKSSTIRRAESLVKTRRAVNRLTGVLRTDFTAEGLQRLTLNFLNAAAPRLDLLEQHADAALAGEVSLMTLMTAMRPLIERAWGIKKAKGPPSPHAAETAQAALFAFFSVGFFFAGGPHGRHAIRRELDGMTGPDGPLSKHKDRAVYYLKPRFARACAAFQSPSCS